MDFIRLKLYYYTLKHIKPKQLAYRIYYTLKRKFPKKLNYIRQKNDNVRFLKLFHYHSESALYLAPDTFTFLNLSKNFDADNIDWNFNKYGKLWSYNLNYFDFLNNSNVTKENGLELIYSHIKNRKVLKDGLESYPISLRGINWIKFICKYKINSRKINQTLYSDYCILINNLEYDIMGNHLLENGFSLFFGAYYFRDENFLKKAIQIINKELKEQVLKDGAHFELSPMYHQIILNRLLELIYLVENNSWVNEEFVSNLRNHASKMVSFLSIITYKDGTIPMLNDSAYNIAPNSKSIFRLAKLLNLKRYNIKLSTSGYRKIENSDYELVMDFGGVGPSYQPGHAHADMLNFELRIKGNPFLVDTGVSNYGISARRNIERKTKSHNTVSFYDQDQSQVWGGFRVAKRAKISSITETINSLAAEHDGYFKTIGNHKRTFTYDKNFIVIKDEVSKIDNDKIIQANFHLYNTIEIIETTSSDVRFSNGVKFNFTSSSKLLKITVEDYNLASGFNMVKPSSVLRVSFKNNLNTSISL